MTNEFVPELHDIGKMVDNAVIIQDAKAHPELHLPIVDANVSGHLLAWVDWEHLDWETEPFKSLKDNPNLPMVRRHHPVHGEEDEFAKLPQGAPPSDILFRKEMLLLKLADHYASTFSRSVAESGEHHQEFKALGDVVGHDRKRMVLWRKKAASNGVALNQSTKFIDLLKTMSDSNLSSEQFLESNAAVLRYLPEDSTAPRDVTSLLTHMTLVGQVYRFLRQAYADQLHDDTVAWLDQAHRVRTVGQAEGRDWLMTLVTCHLKIPQHPVRVGDMNVFRRQELALEKIKGALQNQTLFYTNDTIWFMLPSSHQVTLEKEIEKALAPLYDREAWAESREPGFWAETRALQDIKLRPQQPEIRRLRWQRDRELLDDPQIRERSHYGQIAAEPFAPPLCSICQMRQATKQWPHDSRYSEVQARGGTPEDLCEVCLDIRDVQVEKRFTKLASWHPEEGKAGDLKTAWVKLTLDYDKLIDYLGVSFGEYLGTLRKRVPAENAPALRALDIASQEFNPLALMADYIEDYRRMTQAIDVRLSKDGWEYESIRKKDFRDFFVLKVNNGAEVLRFLQLYGEALLEYFPDALEKCPVRIAVNVSLTKYPFYEHWRWISAPRNAVNLQMPGIARVEIDAREFMEFLTRLNLSDPSGDIRLTRTYLEKLRASEVRTGRSRALLTATLLADIEAKRIPRALQPFITMYQHNQITIQDILDWYKITTWGQER